MRAIGYGRVSTEGQAENGHSLAAQRSLVLEEISRRGWDLAFWTEDARSGKDLDRPGIQTALEALKAKGADCLVVAKLDRVSRSVIDFAQLIERAKLEGWSIVVLDLGIDMTSPNGELIASIMAALAQWERRLISERTKAGLRQARASGRRLGAPRGDHSAAGLIRRLRDDDGLTLQQIADKLNTEGVPSPAGKKWHDMSVYRILVPSEKRGKVASGA